VGFRWGSRTQAPGDGQLEPASVTLAPTPTPEVCQMLGRALERALKSPRPEILDLGSRCGESLVYLAGRGARVTVGEIDPPRPDPIGRSLARGEPGPLLPPIRIEAPESRFNLVLLWEWIDFIPPDRLAEVGGQISRRLEKGGLVLLLSRAVRTTGADERPRRYRVLSDRDVRPEPVKGPALTRYLHPTREIQRAFAPLSLVGIHLQRSQIREVLLESEPAKVDGDVGEPVTLPDDLERAPTRLAPPRHAPTPHQAALSWRRPVHRA
jgi:hypothetical protein